MNIEWDRHYETARSELFFPDENLVRLLNKYLRERGNADLTAADIGCGSGRHIKLCSDLGIKTVLAMDISHRGLMSCKKNFSSCPIQNDNRALPLKEHSIDVAIAWGSLHYAAKDDLALMIGEIRRTLKERGRMFATLRSSRDTHLKMGTDLGNNTWVTDLSDIRGSVVSFYDEDEVRTALSAFSSFRLGLIERTIMGDLGKVLSHWVIDAEK